MSPLTLVDDRPPVIHYCVSVPSNDTVMTASFMLLAFTINNIAC